LGKEERVLNSLLFGLKHARECGFSILLRTENFVPVGIMTAKKPEMDVSKGKTRLWALGIGLDGKVFKEPLDRYNASTQDFESVLFVENDYGIAVTCRRKPEGEDEDNFLYFDNPYDAAEVRKMASDLAAKDRTIASMNRKLEEMRNLRDFWLQQADAFGEEVRNYREQVSRLSKEVALLRSQIELYKRMAWATEVLATEIEALLRKALEEAQEKGEFLGAEAINKVIMASRKVREFSEEIRGTGGMAVSGTMEEEIVKMRKRLESIEEEMKTKQKAAPAPTAA